MDMQECIRFAMENPVCFMATMDGDQPRVRALLMWFANEEGFYFGTFSTKFFSEQMRRNPKVEICFYNQPPDLASAKTLRITGTVEFMEDEKLIHRIATERSFLEQFAGRPLEPITEVFRIHAGEARFWTMHDVSKERELEMLVF